ncbi:hypothetical protein N9D23_02725 [Rubripirellula sp.]|jgi:hypothetical protein|nr:hypothetical protein [Planctomycetaceae bacterium]MDA9857009.1 hypothetical protein [Rubripirellula sp.]MDF1841564.1 hypothetical protein [Rubripirellula sp.]
MIARSNELAQAKLGWQQMDPFDSQQRKCTGIDDTPPVPEHGRALEAAS